MFASARLFALLALTVPAVIVQAQEWDAAKSAKGWARFDATGTASFYDAATKQLITWMKDGGVMAKVDLSKADMVPERWVVDDEHIWIMAGTTLKEISKTGQVIKALSLPAEVGDVDFVPPNGIAIAYRTFTPFIERRDIKNGSVVWSYGTKPRKGDGTARTLHRILRNDEMNLLVMSNGELLATVLDGKKGSALGQAVFTFNDGPPPAVSLGDRDRGPIVWWWSKNIAFSALPASAVPGINQTGLVLARLDFAASAVEFLPTGVTEEFTLAGIIEDRAVLVAPNGGLVYAPIR
jgi:hypothetical protein